jgi:hypothetical protein
LKPKRWFSPDGEEAGRVLAFSRKEMVLPPVRPSTRPRPMNSMVSVAMKAGTRSVVTSTPLMRPTTIPVTMPGENGHADAGVEVALREGDGEDGCDQAVGGADDRSRSLLMMTKVMPTAITP